MSKENSETRPSSVSLSSTSVFRKRSTTLFLGDMTPCFRTGDQLINIRTVREDLQGVLPKVLIFHERDYPDHDGLYTAAISECVVLAALDRNEHGEVDKLAMMHFDGGINKKRLQHFINGIASFSANRELVFYPGEFYRDPESNLYTKKKWNKALESLRPTFNAIHQHSAARSCCVTFDGQVGTFNYDPNFSPADGSPIKIVAIREYDDPAMDRVAVEEFDTLIASTKLPRDLHEFKARLLSSPEPTAVELEVLELSRHLILKTVLFPDADRHVLLEEYQMNVSEFSEQLSKKREYCIHFMSDLLQPGAAASSSSAPDSDSRQLSAAEKDNVCAMLGKYYKNPPGFRLFGALHRPEARAVHSLAKAIRDGKINTVSQLCHELAHCGKSKKILALINQVKSIVVDESGIRPT